MTNRFGMGERAIQLNLETDEVTDYVEERKSILWCDDIKATYMATLHKNKYSDSFFYDYKQSLELIINWY